MILLIDDAPGMGNLVEMSLGREGVQVLQVADLEAAVKAARDEKPVVILLDIALGHEDGLRLLPMLRQDPDLGAIPVIVFTVHPSKETAALEAGAEGFLSKPFRREDLVRVLGAYLKEPNSS